tara:strand:- start:49 stop:633 length:585 start_codon:yes stop_codon:yes gene_type:complete
MKLLFPDVIHEILIPDFKQIEGDLIKSAYKERKKDPIGEVKSNKGGWQSKNLSHSHFIFDFIKDTVVSYFITNRVLKEGVGVNFENAWVNINKKGAYNEKHNHADSNLSGVLWIKAPKDCGIIEFINPSSFSQWKEIESYNNDFLDKIFLYHSWWLEPVPGKILLFPSSLEHLVELSKSNKDRISVSFNITLRT